MASISYAILVCNEHRELDRLLSLLVPFIRPEDEIIVQVDKDKYTSEVMDVLKNYSGLSVCFEKFTGNFADWRNLLTSHCSKDWIFQIDADEVVSVTLIRGIQAYVENVELNQGPENALALPRVNTVLGLTQEDIDRWHWQVNENGWVNWPDYQTRLFRNNGECEFVGKVHEHLRGRIRATAPVPGLALIHPKTIERQRRQNALYDTYRQ